jgi:glutamate/tyrosine decarboxylase-like PLP-dependent enzyme
MLFCRSAGSLRGKSNRLCGSFVHPSFRRAASRMSVETSAAGAAPDDVVAWGQRADLREAVERGRASRVALMAVPPYLTAGKDGTRARLAGGADE